MIELEELRNAAQKAFPADRLRPSRDESWKLIAEMGWLMLELPEDKNGLGLDRDAVATIHYEMGKILSTAPLAPALLSLKAIAASDKLANQEDWIERITSGEYIPLNMLPATIERNADGSMDGHIGGVFEGDMASHVLAGSEDFYELIPLDAPGVTLIERPVWDPTRRLFDVDLSGYTMNPALMVAKGVAAQALHEQLAMSAQLGLAADCLGASRTLLEMTIEYLNMRKQFDRPLAMFQALKHRVADMKVKLTAAEALFWSRISRDSSPVEMGALKAHCASVFRDIAEESIQLYGGIGLTEEHPCHLFFKRAFLNCALCGNIDYLEEQAGRQLIAAS